MRRERQPDAGFRQWGYVEELGWRALRVITLADGETVHNAFRPRFRGEADVKLHYYPETDSLYVEFQRRPSIDTREIAPGVRLDFDEQGRPVGLDIDHASRILDLETLESIGLPLPRATPARRHAAG